MQPDIPESFRELCARAQAQNDLETVAEIVDRILRAAHENSKPHSEGRTRKQPDL